MGGAQLCVPPMGRSPMTSATATRPSRRTIWTGLYQTPASTTRPSRAMPEPSPRPARTATGSNIAPCRYYCPLGGQWGGGHSEHGLSSASPRGHHPVSESLGRMLGPFSPTIHFPDLHINLFGVVPKGHNTGKWRLITDLSFPPGMNDGVDSDLSTLSYSTVDQVTQIVVTLGEGALMAKVDIESSFRLIPVHPDHCPLQGMRWHSQVCIDPMLLHPRSSMRWQMPSTGTSPAKASHTSSITSIIDTTMTSTLLAVPRHDKARMLRPGNNKMEGPATCISRQ